LQKTALQKRFLVLVNEHQGIIHKVCHLYGDTPTERQDLFQEIVLQLWKAFPNYRGEAQISTWMYRVALNTAITSFRKAKRWTLWKTTSIQDTTELSYTPQYPEEDERYTQMMAAIKQLNKIDKAIITLFLEGKKYEEIAEILGTTNGNVRVKMTRIKTKLRNMIKPKK